MKPVRKRPANPAEVVSDPGILASELRELILSTRQTVARGVNAALVLLHWEIGQRIRTAILGEKRAGYGQEIVATLSQQLAAEFGNGFSRFNLTRMIQFAEVFPDERIVATLSRELGWSHFVELLPLKRSLQRDFYAEMCRVERWSVRTLRQKIDGMLYERTALSRKPEDLAATVASTALPTPTALCPPAQGWPVPRAYPGFPSPTSSPTPTGLRPFHATSPPRPVRPTQPRWDWDPFIPRVPRVGPRIRVPTLGWRTESRWDSRRSPCRVGRIRRRHASMAASCVESPRTPCLAQTPPL